MAPMEGTGGRSDDETEEQPRPEAPETPEARPPAEPPPPPLWAAPQNAQPPPEGPQSPQPGPPPGPQSPAPGGPPPPPPAPGLQEQPPGPQSPAGAPPPPPGYGGPVPPGGWHQAAPAGYTGPGELASWGGRAGAIVLDFLFVWVPIAIAITIIAVVATANSTAGIIVGIVLGLASLAYWFLIRSVLMARPGERNGQTWGKQIVGLRVVRDQGTPVNFGDSLVRQMAVKWLLFYIVGGSFFIPWLLNYLWPLWDDTDRALHDMIVSTHVVNAEDA